MKPQYVTIQMKAIEQYLHEVLFVFQKKKTRIEIDFSRTKKIITLDCIVVVPMSFNSRQSITPHEHKEFRHTSRLAFRVCGSNSCFDYKIVLAMTTGQSDTML